MTSTQTATIQEAEEYISCADTAKEIRKALAANFPGVKFGVRSHTYSGGASINVSWTDGPTSEMVDRIAGQFAGCTFDGMVDLKEYHASEYQGRRVQWGANFVFTRREHSASLIDKAARYLEAKYGWTGINREQYWNDYRDIFSGNGGGSPHWTVCDQMHQTLAKMHGNGNLITLKVNHNA